jgi:tetratricopeptide (TPR) repeat protein
MQNGLLFFKHGYTLDELGRHNEAIASYDKAIEFKPDSNEAWNNRGNALFKLGRLEESTSSLDKAVEFKPDSLDGDMSKAIN